MNRPIAEALAVAGVERREFLSFCGRLAALLALPATAGPAIAAALEKVRRPSVIWLSFQECTGCTESLTRSHSPTLENLLLELISLDYHHTLQAASGEAAERARHEAMRDNAGKYIVVVDGSVPLGNPGFSTVAGISNAEMLKETVAGAAAVIAVGSCAAFGGLPAAQPNPTGAVGVGEMLRELGYAKPLVNVPGCPPIPVVITGVIAHYLTFGQLPALDGLGRPLAFYGETIHDRCYRRPFYDQGKFAESFDDDAARQGWCLLKLGCKGPTTHNACATTKWNNGLSFPIQSGHGCLGCSEPKFWDLGGAYTPLPAPTLTVLGTAGVAAAAGAAVGITVSFMNREHKAVAAQRCTPLTVADLEKKP